MTISARKLALAILLIAVFFAVSAGWRAHLKHVEETKYWVYPKALWGGVAPGKITSMQRIQLRVYRMKEAIEGETTYERLDFQVPAAYLYEKDDLAGGDQDEISLSVSWPSGQPWSFEYLRKKAHGELPYGKTFSTDPMKNARVKSGEEWRNNYHVSVEGAESNWRGGEGRSEYSANNVVRNMTEHATPQGKMYGLYAFLDKRPAAYGGFATQYPEAGLTADLFLDSLDGATWRKTIHCGPNYAVCELSTSFHMFPVVIMFSPLNIKDWRAIEKQALSLLDRYLTSHTPPTRMFTQFENCRSHVKIYNNPCSDGRFIDWTRDNINNKLISENFK